MKVDKLIYLAVIFLEYTEVTVKGPIDSSIGNEFVQWYRLFDNMFLRLLVSSANRIVLKFVIFGKSFIQFYKARYKIVSRLRLYV